MFGTGEMQNEPKAFVVPGSKKVILKRSKFRGAELKEFPMDKATTISGTKQIPMES